MLGEHPITPVLASHRPCRSQGSSNHGQLELPIIREDENAIVFRGAATAPTWT
jgi:hypothetical protein